MRRSFRCGSHERQHNIFVNIEVVCAVDVGRAMRVVALTAMWLLMLHTTGAFSPGSRARGVLSAAKDVPRRAARIRRPEASSPPFSALHSYVRVYEKNSPPRDAVNPDVTAATALRRCVSPLSPPCNPLAATLALLDPPTPPNNAFIPASLPSSCPHSPAPSGPDARPADSCRHNYPCSASCGPPMTYACASSLCCRWSSCSSASGSMSR